MIAADNQLHAKLAPQPPRFKLRVSDSTAAAQLFASGGRQIADYGSFQVVSVDEATLLEWRSRPGVEDITEQNLITLNTGSLDTTLPDIAALRQQTIIAQGKQLHLVHFAGPIKPEWRQSLEDTGVQVVTYIPHNAYLIYADATALTRMQTWAKTTDYVQWEGSYSYKIHPDAQTVDAKGQPKTPTVDWFAIQIVEDAQANPATLRLINTLQLEPIRDQSVALHYLNVIVRVPAERLPEIAAQPEVVSIQAYPEPKKRDESQDQIIAGNLTLNAPSGPGYLGWLASKGFTQAQFLTSGFVVDVSDSGIDNGTTAPGHFGLYLSGDSTLASRVIYNRLQGTPNGGSTIQSCDGHGNLNSHIIAGFNDQASGFPHTDALGFHYGLGVCPFVQVGSSVIFDPNTYTSPNLETLQSQAFNDGARISANSWGANTAGGYNLNAQRYDALVRDAQPATSPFPAVGNQEMVIVFAAGNAGPGAGSVGAPGTAKNVFSVGATENVRSHSIANGGRDSAGNDGCLTPDVEADSANDMAVFSSRGPCSDGRKKPDIVAPGTHVTGGIGQVSPPPSPAGVGSAIGCFSGEGVCALDGSGTIGSQYNFFPMGQQFFTTSSGTSHSTPAVAGSCALLRQYFINQGFNPPSPAMTKAYLMNSARYLNGAGANDTLPSNSQGMGDVNMGVAFDGANRVLRDELAADKFTASGQSRTFAGTIQDPSKPFRVTLAWTDAPGNTTGNAYNNDLDLTVTVGGVTYKGNVFSGANSTAGGSADPRNNVESVFLPAGFSNNFVVTITAANINSDGVPNEAPTLDQDFGLVIYNAAITPVPVIQPDTATILAEGCTPTNNAADPGETVTMLFALKNIGTSNTLNVAATLLATNGVASPSGPQTYGPLLAGGPATAMPFTFSAIGGCGATIAPTLHVQDGTQDLGTVTFLIQLGTPVTALSENFDGVSAPSLPAGWTTATSGGQSLWVTSVSQSDTAPNSAFSPDATTTGVNELVTPVISVPYTAPQLSFRQSFIFENGYDGGVLEISINGSAYVDILAAGGSFASGGYVSVLNSSANPLTGRSAWTGNSGGFITTLVNLPPAAAGLPARFKWRAGSDGSIGATGCFIDSVKILGRDCCGPLIVANGSTLMAESCTNTYVDPGEIVTLNLGLKNVGTSPAGNVVATLLSGGGVNSPSDPQTYGPMSSGASASMPFTFTASGACGGSGVFPAQWDPKLGIHVT